MTKTFFDTLTQKLAAFCSAPNFRSVAVDFFKTLGYESSRTLQTASVDAFRETFDHHDFLSHESALVTEWQSAHLLFQLTDEELAKQISLFDNLSTLEHARHNSYIFLAIELKGADYARGKLAAITRRLNRVFPQPVIVLFKTGKADTTAITLAVINRRTSKADADKDVLGKVTLIRDIDTTNPHRGHLDILTSFAFDNLVHPHKKPIVDFDTLHATWEQIFNVELLNERFYRELADWYFWALPQVEFPDDLSPDSRFKKEDDRLKNAEKRRATNLIRLLTRLIFCWFLKEKDLIPEQLFHPVDLETLLKGFDPESETSCTYYQAILQNLFFATLNQRMDKDSKGQPFRRFITGKAFQGKNDEHGITTLYRYSDLFTDPDSAIAAFADIPFLNGGLFECLDREDPDNKNRMLRLDGFTSKGKRPHVPDRLFFDGGETADLSEAYGDKKRKAQEVTGLIHILNRYKFTIVENTPIDQEIALDPELLGKVFENLLASYNEETKTTARKQTGSFYTPRSIVNYMVDESLKANLVHPLMKKGDMKERDAQAGLDILFAYTEKEHAFTSEEVDCLIAAIDALKILDPACGSGAFPMGVLQKLVYILGKLDPNNDRWKETQLAKLDSAPMREELENAFAENNDDYGRKLYLIENCLYGVDIQPIAIQISKLRFFISLVCDQKTNRNKKKNHGIRPLPNLETKFVAADSLIGLPAMEQAVLVDPRVYKIEEEIEKLYHGHFSIQRRDQKLAVQSKIKTLRKEMADALAGSIMSRKKSEHIAAWDPFDPQSVADFFDPHWMFGRSLKDGFDIVIGNPPYIQIQNFSGQTCQKEWQNQGFQTFAKTGDIYCLFYERGFELMRLGGVLCYITSNKWMRAGYGKALRKFLLENGRINQLIDLGDSPVFKAATTYTNILLWSKIKDPRLPVVYDLNAVYSDSTTLDDMLLSAGADEPLFSEHSFVIAGKAQTFIKKRIEQVGTPLKEWNIVINYGIKTGCNEAFIITVKKKDELIAQDPKSAEIIKPILRGRDIKRYQEHFADLWVINTHNGYVGSSGNRVPRIDIPKDYPAVWTYLQEQNKAMNGRLENRADQGDHWTNLRNCAYLEEIRKEKVLYAEIVYDSAFFYDTHDFYPEATTFIMTGENLKYLTALLNSKLVTYAFKTFYAGGDLRGNTFRYKKVFLHQLPIPQIPKLEQQPFEVLVDCVLFARANGLESEADQVEDVLDGLVYDLYFEEEMREANCRITDRVAEVVKPFKEDDTDAFKTEYIQKLCAFFRKDDIVFHGLIHRRTIDVVKIITGTKQ